MKQYLDEVFLRSFLGKVLGWNTSQGEVPKW